MKTKDEEIIKKQFEILKNRIETEENHIPYNSMLRILSKINDRCNIIIEDCIKGEQEK